MQLCGLLHGYLTGTFNVEAFEHRLLIGCTYKYTDHGSVLSNVAVTIYASNILMKKKIQINEMKLFLNF